MHCTIFQLIILYFAAPKYNDWITLLWSVLIKPILNWRIIIFFAHVNEDLHLISQLFCYLRYQVLYPIYVSFMPLTLQSFPPAFHSSSYHIYFTMSSLFRSVFTARFHFTFRKGRKKTKQARSGVAIWIILCEQSQILTSTLYLRRKGHIMGLFCIGLGTTDSQTWKQVCLNL